MITKFLAVVGLICVSVPSFATKNLTVSSCFYLKNRGEWVYLSGSFDRVSLPQFAEISKNGGITGPGNGYVRGLAVGSSDKNKIIEGADISCDGDVQTIKKEISYGESVTGVAPKCGEIFGFAFGIYVATPEEAMIFDKYESQEASDLYEKICERLQPIK